jgi:hypothetical protein
MLATLSMSCVSRLTQNMLLTRRARQVSSSPTPCVLSAYESLRLQEQFDAHTACCSYIKLVFGRLILHWAQLLLPQVDPPPLGKGLCCMARLGQASLAIHAALSWLLLNVPA